MAALGFCNSARAGLVLNAIYGDGAFPATGNPYFQYDYVELYNSGASAISLNNVYLDMSGFATEPIGLTSRENLALPTGASVAAGGYYLIQINNGTSSPAFTGIAQFTAPTPDLVLVYNSTQANFSSSYNGGSTGNLFSQPYYQAGKFGLITGGSTGTLIDYVGYGAGNVSGSASFGTNNFWSSVPGYVGTEFAGYNYYVALYGGASNVPTTGGSGILGSSQALIRTNPLDSYPSEDNNNDWAVETVFSLTNSAGQSVTVPEPATLGLLAAGSALLMLRRRTTKA
jgi:hypothetical protein